jgi:RNA polymerase sigma factor (sigma-70 family)
MGLPAIESSGRSQDTEVLFREHGAAVARFCRSLLRDHAEAEDAAQQVFLSAHRALLNGSIPRDPLPWLLTVARHECYARFRQRQVSPVPAGDGHDGTTPDASVHVLRAGQIATLWDEVERMPRAQRDAFVLREIRGLSYTQLADELALSAASVRSLLVRARTRLRHRLRDVAPSLGGAPWIQTLVRLVGGGDGASPVPAATKAAAVGIGALALMGGGDLARAPHHAARAAVHRQSHSRAHRASTPTPVVAAPVEDRPGRDARGSDIEHSRRHGDGSHESHSGRSSDGNGDAKTSSGDGSSGSGHDGSDDTTAATRPATSGRDGGSGSDGSSGSGRENSHDSSSGSSSGSDDGSGSGSSSGGHGSGGSGDDGGSSGSDG